MCEIVGSNPTGPTTDILGPPLESMFFKTALFLRTREKVTRDNYIRILKQLSRKVDLTDPVATEGFILGLDGKNKYKNNLFSAYLAFCRANEIHWARPKGLKNETYPIKVPTEERIDHIISGSTPTYSVVFNVSKHGLRPDELGKITLRDIDLERGELVVRTSKQGLGRTLKLSREVTDMLREFVAWRRISGLDQRLFAKGPRIGAKWREFRRRAYERLRDPELLKIRLYDLRHWYGTTQYLRTRDIFHVKYLLGHRHIQSTLVYIHIAKGLVNYSEDYTCKVASTVEESQALVESGFEYVATLDGNLLFRNRK